MSDHAKRGQMTVLSRGAVTPNGWSMPGGAARSSTEALPLISFPEHAVPVQKISESGPLWDRWKKEPRLRRASPIARFLAQAVSQALEGADPVTRRGLIGVFSTGAIVYSRKFYEGYGRQGRALASPALFPETVFNSPLSHVAAIFGFEGPVYSLVGDESAWVEACATADLWLQLGVVKEVVVVAAEEIEALTIEAFHSLGWLRQTGKYLPAEGAGAVRLGGGGATGPQLMISAHSHPFFDRVTCRRAAERVLEQMDIGGLLLRTAQGLWSEALEAQLVRGRRELSPAGDYAGLGRSMSATGAWATLYALSQLNGNQPRIHIPVFGCNQAVAALTVTT